MRPVRLAILVNRKGLGSRRANELAQRMPPSFSVEVVAEPTLRAAYEAASRADLVYVIDAGRHGVRGIASTRLRRRRLVVECGDSSPALYRSMGRSRPAIVAGAVVDRFVGRHSDAVVVRWRECAEVMDVRVPWIEVADGVDVTRFSPELENGARARHGIPPDALVVGLVGSLTWSSGAKLTYGWDVVEALARLRDKPVWGLVVGGGDGLKRLGSRAVELGVADRLVLTGEVEHRDVPQYICALDVCVSTQTNDAVGRSRTTSKLPEYLACDRFVLATAVGAARVVLPPEMLLPYEGTVDHDHPSRLARRLAELVPRRDELRAGGGTRPLALERYDYDVLAERLASFLLEVSG